MSHSTYRTSAISYLVTLLSCYLLVLSGCSPKVNQVHIANGWAQNAVNTVIFRNYALYTHDSTQFTAFYDGNMNLVLAKRTLGSSRWQLRKTPYQGNALDAHNAISLIVDTAGFLHVSWDHHNNLLRYARSKEPLSLELTSKLPMTGQEEQLVTYPQFYQLPEGQMLFFYRSGGSGRGDLMINQYDASNQTWSPLQHHLISGEGERNAYWQTSVDEQGIIHLSWVWRESPDVASNHDLCYARSADGGKTWLRTDGSTYTLPITAENAEIIVNIPQGRELINQTAMTTDPMGHPVIASYWRPEGSDIPQYHVVYFTGDYWKVVNTGFRKTPFSLSGTGTKAIPISRPQVVSGQEKLHLIFRDQERGNKVSVASSELPELKKWKFTDLTSSGYTGWEPTLDPVVWRQEETLHLFLQNVTQVDGEGISQIPPQPIKVLEWKPGK